MKALLSFMERVMGVHTVTKDNEEMSGIMKKSVSNATDYKSQPLLTSVVKPLSGTRT